MSDRMPADCFQDLDRDDECGCFYEPCDDDCECSCHTEQIAAGGE